MITLVSPSCDNKSTGLFTGRVGMNQRSGDFSRKTNIGFGFGTNGQPSITCITSQVTEQYHTFRSCGIFLRENPHQVF